MTLDELRSIILSNVDDFDKFLRNNFDFDNVRVLHDDIVNYDDMVVLENNVTRLNCVAV